MVNPHFSKSCPLCLATEPFFYLEDRKRSYQHCQNCGLVFVPPGYFLDRDAERACYERHENSPEDHRYRQFLNRLLTPLIPKLKPGSRGLDFGAGPGPTLSVMLNEIGFEMAIYDPFYAPDNEVLSERYDFVTATEVVEHFFDPRQDLDTIWGLIKPGGILGIMTKRVLDKEAFAEWHYKNDPTHVCFFAEETFTWLAKKWQANVEFPGKDVVIFHKIPLV